MGESLRQGDVAFFRIDSVPPGFKEMAQSLVIRGEREGHTHTLEGVRVFGPTGAVILEMSAPGREQLPREVIEVLEKAGRRMIHPDHPAAELLPGIYAVHQARGDSGD